MTYYGRRSTSYESYWELINYQQLIVSMFNRNSANRWAIRGGIYAGRYTGSNGLLRICVYEDAPPNNIHPETLLAYTSAVTVSTPSNYPSGGDDYEAAWSWTADSNLKGLKLYANRRYAIGAVNTGAITKLSVMPSWQLFGEDNENFYYRSSVSLPPNPIGNVTVDLKGHLTAWLVYETNYAPNTPTNGLAPSGVVTSITPTITADFDDKNGTWGEANGFNDAGDLLKYYQIQVIRASDNVLMWDSGIIASSSSERTNDAVSRAYAGTTLVRGTEYKWRIRMADQFDTWSNFSAYTSFTPADLGHVVVTSPSGKIEDSTPDFTATWTHQTPLSTNAVMVQIRNAQGAVLQTSGWIADSTAHNGTITVTWAEASAAGLVDLGWDKDLIVAIKGRDTNNVESAYSDPVSFRTNAAPGVPTNLTSTLGTLVTSYPGIRSEVVDEDDTSATGLAVTLRVLSQMNVANPAFGSNITGFAFLSESMSFGDSVAHTAGQGHDATGAADITITTVPGTSNQSLVYAWSDDIPCVVGETYGISLWLRKDHATDLDCNARINWYTSGGSLISSTDASDIADTANTWLQSTASGVAPATAAKYRMAVRIRNPGTSIGATRHIYVDDAAPTDWQVRYHRSKTYNATTGKWEYTITSTDFPAYGTYRVDEFSYDGTLYSGEQTTNILATKSSTLQIVYAQGPVVTMDEPDDLDTVVTSALLVQWTTTTQAKYRVKLALAGDSTFIYDSGDVVDTGLREHLIPAGNIRTGFDYDVYLLVTDTNPLTTTVVHEVTASFTPPDTVLDFQAIPIALGNDPFETSVQMYWQQTNEPLVTFVRYEIWRRSDSEYVKLAELPSPFQTSFVDYEPVSGVFYTYEIVQITLDGLDYLSSEAATATTTVVLGGAVLVAVEEPDAHRSALHIADNRGFSRKDQTARFIPPAGVIDNVTGVRRKAQPITIRASSRWFEWSITAQLVSWRGISAHDRYNELLALDEHGGIICYRDDFGRILYGTIDQIDVIDHRPGRYEVSVTMIEETFQRVAL